ncbi:MAG: formylglycine-generating enzyme family protein [Pirellulaceae bacterium]|nr:formylglycine-generating enzyme family protein [Pirellulaceae bacterium]
MRFAVVALSVFVSSTTFAAEPQLLTNSLGMKLVRLEPGEFQMGSPETEEGRGDDELRHKVRITKPFYLGKHEVTVGQFRKFAEATAYKTTLEKTGGAGFGFDAAAKGIEILPKFTWREVGWEQTDNHPATNLSWDDATAFCKWLSATEGRRYTLPTEAQWEYACRAGTTTRYSTGEAEESLQGTANVSDASFLGKYANATWSVEWDDGHAFAAPVGSLKPNAWGLCDMHGNVWEWCADWYGRDYYAKSPQDDPTGPDSGTVHVLRGGAFTNRFRFVRSADRDAERPKYRYNFTGFRVAAE